MRNLHFYYLVIMLPVLLLARLSLMDRQVEITILLLVYVIPCRLFTDGMRLAGKGLLKRQEVWRLPAPWLRMNFFHGVILQKVISRKGFGN